MAQGTGLARPGHSGLVTNGYVVFVMAGVGAGGEDDGMTYLGSLPKGTATCETCGHPTGEHRELPYGSEGYAPLAFHCGLCECVNNLAAGEDDGMTTTTLWKVNVRRPVTRSRPIHLVEHLGGGETALETLCGLRYDWRGILRHDDEAVTCRTCERLGKMTA